MPNVSLYSSGKVPGALHSPAAVAAGSGAHEPRSAEWTQMGQLGLKGPCKMAKMQLLTGCVSSEGTTSSLPTSGWITEHSGKDRIKVD